ncbi:MAG: hypothetical protein H6713_26920 [Myxococcales bacterium]|nr:hypothetical protein [Myxococcales bacterium]
MTQSEPWRQDGAMLEDAPDLKDELRALKRCGIDLHSIDDVWVGAGEAAGRDNVVAIVHAPGVGSEKTMRCVAAIESLAAKPAKLQRSGCANTLEVEDEAQLVGLDLDHLAIVSRSWVKTVIQRARAGERADRPRRDRQAAVQPLPAALRRQARRRAQAGAGPGRRADPVARGLAARRPRVPR